MVIFCNKALVIEEEHKSKKSNSTGNIINPGDTTLSLFGENDTIEINDHIFLEREM